MNIVEADLGNYDYVLCLDQSGSMNEETFEGSGVRRWKAAQEMTLAVARKCAEFDEDGIDVYTFNKRFEAFPNTTPEKVKEIFAKTSPAGGTDFIPVLSEVWRVAQTRSKPCIVLVITDGQPTDGPAGEKATAKLIVDISKKMESDADFSISFFQIGNDPDASVFLKKLDDNLKDAGAKFDIVDTKTFDELDGMRIEDALLAAVND